MQNCISIQTILKHKVKKMTNKFILIIWIAFSYSFDMYAQVALDLECEDVLSFSTNGSSTFMTIKDSSGQLSHEWFMTDFGLIEYRVYGKNRKDSIYVLFGKRGEILEMRTDTSLFLYFHEIRSSRFLDFVVFYSSRSLNSTTK